MKKRVSHHLFALTGRQGFPMDFLRAVNGWPASMLDSNEIIETYKAHRTKDELPYIVRLTSVNAPTEELLNPSGKRNHTGWNIITMKEYAQLRLLVR